MQYTTLGTTGLIVSRFSFGAMTFTAGNKGIPAVYKTEAADADAMVGRALDAGINFFDTADAYAGGDSEVMLGKALQQRRQDVIITTKVGNRTGDALTQTGLSRRHILMSVEQSLQRLGTDWIDTYVVHREDRFTPLEETLAALDEIVRAGKVRYLGFSNWAPWKVSAALELQKANGWARFTHGQMAYSLLTRDVERDMVPLMQHYGLGLTVWSPLAMGFLSGKYTRENLQDTNNRYSGFDILPFDKEHGFQVVELLRGIANRRQVSVAQVALAWLLAKPVVHSIIIGASKPHQLEDNLAAAGLALTAEEVAELDTATPLPPVYPYWFNEFVTDPAVVKALGHS